MTGDPTTDVRPAAVVFDVDGTLVDSERDGHRVAFNAAFAAAGLPDRWSVDEYGELLATAGGRHRLEQYLLRTGRDPDRAAALARDLHADKTRILREMVDDGRVTARPGAHRLLRELQDAGVRLAVATTGSRAWVAPLLARCFPDITFAPTLTADEVPDRKPDPAVYREALARLGTRPEDTLVIEDAEKGVVAARGAGLDCLVTVNDYTRHESFAAARLVVDGFGDDRPARVLAGPEDALDRGHVTARTCAVLTSGARGGHHDR